MERDERGGPAEVRDCYVDLGAVWGLGAWVLGGAVVAT